MSEVSKKKKAAKPKETKSTASASTKPVDDGNTITAAQAQPKQTASGLAALTGHYQAPIAPPSDLVVKEDNGDEIEVGITIVTKSNTELDKQVDDGLLDLLDREAAIEVLGAMEVSSRSDNGFWRSGVHFSRTEKTVVIVVSDDDIKNPELSQSGLGIESAFPVVFMAPSQAKRVHDEPHLKVEVLELESLIGE
ncbi:hypothetical protein PVK64_19305 [Aliivibrio sp. S4TY2]|uniref:hypothetical protein n=1 Tax=unclassified Aliivibrio TaxID=2645654 RepID=UPI002379C2FC|nr:MULTISPECIES: hypothetical protein [unclassified Aliivibrio]MDD9158315.1 hypothetical protein [Aliivibrio sp. S4TY2]MDD9162285.1 hypothetical protein [Aliivibrio sp. S4TY1]MDD9166323.1 hypothetical protein [Aliivibrio sp. S4MY2]MDD9170321.1 hypothetical protein [Aliivibrio sp. S4MY4]MDD9187372.1 hypothetical protein [Aliivibrio sp. S4MY3]